MFCNACGQPLPTGARFCNACGGAVIGSQEPSQGRPDNELQGSAGPARDRKRKWPIGKLIIISCYLLIVMAAGVVAAVYFGIRYAFKSSEAYKVAIETLKQNPTATWELGEIYDTGLPAGSVSSESGGSGNASLSMTVKGRVNSAQYFATLQRRNGVWRMSSGRLVLRDGREIAIGGMAFLSIASPSGGRQLRNSSIDTSGWRRVVWPEQQMRLSLPPDWISKTKDQRQLDFRVGEVYSSTYLTANAWIFDRELPSANLLQADLETESERFRNGVTSGYSVREVGNVI